MSSRITQTAESITSEVQRATGAEESLSSRITQTASSVSLVVQNGSIKAAEIVAAINDTGSTVKIGASHIILDGQVVADSLSSDDVQVSQLNVTEVNAGSVTAGSLAVDTGHGTIDVVDMEDRLEDVEEAADAAVASIGPATASGGRITIPWTKNDGTAGTPINFNIADTQYYQDGVSAAYSDGWDAARAMVAPPSQGTGTTFTFKAPSATEDTQETYTFTIQKGSTPGSTGYASVALNGTLVGHVSIGDWYDTGYTDGQDSVTLSASGWTGPNGRNTITATNGETLVVALPTFTASGGTTFTNHKTTVNFSTASVTSGPLKSVEVDATNEYNTGYSDGYDDAAGASYDHLTYSSSDIGDPSSNYNPGSVRCTAYDGGGASLGYQDLSLYLTEGSWNSSNKKAVNIRVGSNRGNRIARLWVTAPSASVGTPYINNPAQGYIRAVVVVNGQTYYGSSVKLTSSQISSWGGPV